MQGESADLRSLVDGGQIETGLPGGAQLIGFVEAVVADGFDADSEERIAHAREALVDALGDEATVDAAAVIANFQRMVRIADSTGIPLDEPMVMMTQSIRSELGLDDYQASSNTPALNPVKRLVGRLLGPFAPRLLRQIARRRAGP